MAFSAPVLALALGLALSLPQTSLARTPGPTLAAEAALRVLQSASEQLTAAEKARDRVAALTGVISAYETGLAALRDGLRQVTIHETALARALAAEEATISRLIAALTALEQTPPSLLALHPSGPVDAARSGMLMAEIAPELHRQAEDLRSRLAEVRALRALQAEALAQLGTGMREVQSARTALSQAIASRAPLPDRAVEKAAATQRLAEAARTMEAFLTALAGEGADIPPPAAGNFAPLLPVQGRLLRAYNEADAAGIVRPGWIFATEPQALVTAPAPATIRYLGPLLDYGKVMILEPSSDTLLVLAGLGSVYGEIGQVVNAGDPLGLMGGTADPLPEGARAEDAAVAAGVAEATRGAQGSAGSLAGAEASVPRQGRQRSETLYLEVRRDGRSVDPGTWFEGTKDAN